VPTAVVVAVVTVVVSMAVVTTVAGSDVILAGDDGTDVSCIPVGDNGFPLPVLLLVVFRGGKPVDECV
jgi:hypothetical protein